MNHPSHLGENHRRRLLTSCQHIDRLLGDVAVILRSSTADSVFPRYRADLTEAQTKTLDSFLAEMRRRLQDVLIFADVESPPPQIPISRAVTSRFAFVEIAIEELKPKYMIGSGQLSTDGQQDLYAVVHELELLAARMTRFAQRELEVTVTDRVKHLGLHGGMAGSLLLLSRAVDVFQLVQFRPLLEQLIQQAGQTEYQIAFFGQVSSGKSSLINALLETDWLPVGAIPVTALPIRMQYAKEESLKVTFADGQTELREPYRIAEFATEAGNPDNRLQISRLELGLSLGRLQGSVVVVDTPGLGSLARSGQREAMAYLPAADLAFVLVNAGSTLDHGDLELLRLLTDAGIEAQVLLSKADLLEKEELRAALDYLDRMLKANLVRPPATRAVSALPAWKWSLNQFYDEEIQRRFQQAEVLRQQSMDTKLRSLGQLILASLQAGAKATEHSSEGQTRDHQRQSGAALSAFRSEFPNRLDKDWSASTTVPELQEALLVRTQETELRHLTTANVEEELHELFHRRLQQVVRELTELQQAVGEGGNTQAGATAATVSISLRDAPRPTLSIQRQVRILMRLGVLQLPAWLMLWQIRKGLIEPLLPEIKDRVRLARQQVAAWIQEALEAITEQQERQEIERLRPSLLQQATVSTPEQKTALKELQGWISAVPMKEIDR